MAYKLTLKQIETVVKNASRLLFKYCQKNNLHYLVVGISGGLDSAVTLALAREAQKLAVKNNFELTNVGLIMPCESTQESSELGEKVIKKFQAELIYKNLTKIFYGLLNGLWDIDEIILQILGNDSHQVTETAKKIAAGNIKARLRMIHVYHVAGLLKGMVLSTDNLSEYWMGFWTICGDVGDYGMIQNILKGYELPAIARYIDVPQEVIEAKPDDGLGVTSGGDEAQLGGPYPIVDRVMLNLIQAGFNPNGQMNQLDDLLQIKGVEPKTIKNMALRSLKTTFKRKGTINLTRKQLGLPPISKIKL